MDAENRRGLSDPNGRTDAEPKTGVLLFVREGVLLFAWAGVFVY